MLVHLIVLIPDMEAVPCDWDHIGSISPCFLDLLHLFKIRKSGLGIPFKSGH